MQTADHILIPLLDGRHALAQVAHAGTTYSILFMTSKIAGRSAPTSALRPADIVAVVQIDPESVSGDQWPVIGYDAIPRDVSTSSETANPDDTKDPAIVEAFANAIHGLYPWDGFPDPDFFTTLLRTPDALPTKARMTADFPTPD